MLRTVVRGFRFRPYEDEGAFRNLIWQDGGLRAGEIGSAQEADAAVLHHLDRAVVPKFDHPEVFLVRDLQFREPVGLQPGLRGHETFGVASSGRHDLYAEAFLEPLLDAAHHQRHRRTDMAHALPRRRLGQRAIQIDPDPALLIRRTGGRGAFGRHRFVRRLAEVRRGRLRGEERTKPREHASTVGIGRAGARIEVGAAPRAALVQKCKPAYGLCKGAKVGDINSGGGWQPRGGGGGGRYLEVRVLWSSQA